MKTPAAIGVSPADPPLLHVLVHLLSKTCGFGCHGQTCLPVLLQYTGKLLLAHATHRFRCGHALVAVPSTVVIVTVIVLVIEVIKEVRPDEIYNLAAQSFVGASWRLENLTWEVNAYGVERLLKAAKKYCPKAKFYQASTSEMFGDSNPPQNEESEFKPVSPYAEAKLYAHRRVQAYRKDGMFAVGGILFNHESPRRGLEFVTRKITRAIAQIKLGLQNELRMGNLNAKRDWGFAGDYVKVMHAMLQQETPEDYVIATGINHSVREFLENAFNAAGMPITEWKGEGLDEKGYISGKEDPVVVIDEKFYRPTETSPLLGDSSKAHEKLGWKPEVSFSELVTMMVENDIRLAEQERTS